MSARFFFAHFAVRSYRSAVDGKNYFHFVCDRKGRIFFARICLNHCTLFVIVKTGADPVFCTDVRYMGGLAMSKNATTVSR